MTQPALIPLLETVPGIHRLLPLHDGTPEVEYDAEVEIMELPHFFRTTLVTIPAEIPYLQVKPLLLAPDNQKPAVGLVWKAGDWDERRSLLFSYLMPLAALQNINFYIPQAGAPTAGWKGEFGNYPGSFSLFDYARILSGLDLLITVDSMPAHLASALGVPVWTLLHAGADWWWKLENREDSSWYPTMRLFRQTRPGDWEGVIERVTAELKKLGKV